MGNTCHLGQAPRRCKCTASANKGSSFPHAGRGRIKGITQASAWHRAGPWRNMGPLPLGLRFHQPMPISCLQHSSLLRPAASVPLTHLEKEKEGIRPLVASCPPSSAPKGGIHGLRSEPWISCVILSSAWTISFPAQKTESGLILPYHL